MEPVWYFVANGVQSQPVSWAELKEAATSGKLTPNDLVWKEGTPDWVAARTVADLFAAAPPRPPAPPMPPAYGLSPLPPPPPAHPAVQGAEPLPLPLDDEPRKSRPRRERDRGPNAPPQQVPEWVKLIPVFARRAFYVDPAQTAPVADEEAALTRAGVMDATARRFAVWRRAVLFASAVPCAFAALFGLVNVIAMDHDSRDAFSNFGLFLLYVQALALFALPAAAVLGALTYDRLSASSTWVLGGGLISFLVPLGVAFVPSDWLIDLKTTGNTTVAQLEAARGLAGLLFGVQFYLLLMPAVLSLLPAVARACVRMKLLLPESLVPGWGLVTSAPLCVLLTLATFVLLYHVVGNALLILGLLLWVGAPLLYLYRFSLLTRPVTSPADRAALANTTLAVLGLALAGVLLLVVFLFTAKLRLPGSEPHTLMGFDSKTSVFRPWTLDLHKIWIEYVGRALFLSVFFGDLILRMALSVWREGKAFAGSAEAAGFDRTMSGLGAAVLPRRGPPAP